MTRQRSLLLLIGYGFAATMSIFYGLVERHSLFVTFISFHLLVCVCIPVFHGWWEGNLRQNWRRAWGRFEKQGALYGIGFGLFLMIGAAAGIWLLLQTEGRADEIRSILVSWGLTDRRIWWFSLYLAVMNSLFEELLWRGFVLQRLLHVLSRTVSILLSSFFYSLYHLVIATALFGLKWGLCMTFLVYVTGVLWGWMKGLFPSIYPTWFSHMLVDLGIVAAVVFWIY